MFSFIKKKEETVSELKAVVSRKVISIDMVEDEVFASEALGKGIAIEPEENTVIAPCDGVVSIVMAESKHAVGMTLNNGAEILIHEGLDTVEMNGEGFELFVKEGDKVKTGDRMIQFNPTLIREKGHKITCVMVVTNSDEFPDLRIKAGMYAKAQETVVIEF